MDIVAAIEAGDAKSAEVLVRTHIRNVPWQQLLQGSEIVVGKAARHPRKVA